METSIVDIQLEIPEKQESLFEAAAEEAHTHKWIESEKAGYDLGENAIAEWYSKFWRGFCRECYIEHLGGKRFWIELDSGDFGLLKQQFHNNMGLVNKIIDIFKNGGENLDVVNFAISNQLDIEEVLHLLHVLDINARRISPAVKISKVQFVQSIRSSHNARAIIIDNDENTCNEIAYYVTEEKMEAISVQTGDEALEIIQKKQFDLFFVNILLAHKHGAEIAWYLKRHGVCDPIIAVCDSLESWTEDDLYDCGFTHIMSKPLNGEEISRISAEVWAKVEQDK